MQVLFDSCIVQFAPEVWTYLQKAAYVSPNLVFTQSLTTVRTTNFGENSVQLKKAHSEKEREKERPTHTHTHTRTEMTTDNRGVPPARPLEIRRGQVATLGEPCATTPANVERNVCEEDMWKDMTAVLPYRSFPQPRTCTFSEGFAFCWGTSLAHSLNSLERLHYHLLRCFALVEGRPAFQLDSSKITFALTSRERICC